MNIRILVIFLTFSAACGQFYEDKRCRCVCPSLAALLNISVTDQKVYTSNVPPNKCNCEGVILKKFADELKGHEQEFCPRCECKYEQRNTTIIMVVVIMLLWVLTILSGYMGFLMCLDPLINKRRVKYHQEVETGSGESTMLLLEEPDD